MIKEKVKIKGKITATVIALNEEGLAIGLLLILPLLLHYE
jgi:hypothetical protein